MGEKKKEFFIPDLLVNSEKIIIQGRRVVEPSRDEEYVRIFIIQASIMILGSLTKRITCTAIKHKHNTRDKTHKEFSLGKP